VTPDQLKAMPIPDGPFILAVKSEDPSRMADQKEMVDAISGWLRSEGLTCPIFIFVRDLDEIRVVDTEIMAEYGWQRIP